MKKETIIVWVIGVVTGMIMAGFVASQAVNRNDTQVMRLMGMDTSSLRAGAASSAAPTPSSTSHSHMSMAEMSQYLAQYTGDDFDKAFLEMMIAHHEGALDMANIANKNAKHDEIKQLSNAILLTQQKEINDMHTWQHSWGYVAPDGSGATQMMHSHN